MEDHFHVFKTQIAKFANMDIDDESMLKQLLYKIINKIEVHEGGTIKIHYNIARPHVKCNL